MLEIGNFKIDPPWRVLNYLYWRVGGRKGCFRSTREVKLIKRITANEKKPEFLFNLNPRWEKKTRGRGEKCSVTIFPPINTTWYFFFLSTLFLSPSKAFSLSRDCVPKHVQTKIEFQNSSGRKRNWGRERARATKRQDVPATVLLGDKANRLTESRLP